MVTGTFAAVMLLASLLILALAASMVAYATIARQLPLPSELERARRELCHDANLRPRGQSAQRGIRSGEWPSHSSAPLVRFLPM